jgi:hypothetical protein
MSCAAPPPSSPEDTSPRDETERPKPESRCGGKVSVEAHGLPKHCTLKGFLRREIEERARTVNFVSESTTVWARTLNVKMGWTPVKSGR